MFCVALIVCHCSIVYCLVVVVVVVGWCRQAALGAGLPHSVPCTTVNKGTPFQKHFNKISNEFIAFLSVFIV
jgi:hypothetical protein